MPPMDLSPCQIAERRLRDARRHSIFRVLRKLIDLPDAQKTHQSVLKRLPPSRCLPDHKATLVAELKRQRRLRRYRPFLYRRQEHINVLIAFGAEVRLRSPAHKPLQAAYKDLQPPQTSRGQLLLSN